jgi:Protein of unknown function DUF262/Protein of unknown function (DUF1524)
MFEATSRSIGELLGPHSRKRLIVPEFQRGYSWEKKHVAAFWNDVANFQIESAAKDGPTRYFLGPIVVLESSDRRSQIVEVLDGQQRLATATILFSVLRDMARELRFSAGTDLARDVQSQMIEKEDGTTDDDRYALKLGDTDGLYFRETIQTDPPSPKTATLRSHQNITAAQKYLSGAVNQATANMDPAQKLAYLKRLWRSLRTDFVMACIPVDSERDAFRIFETLNDRGLRLSVPDLLLNYLMRRAEPVDRKEIRALWTEILEDMGRKDINKFLRHLWVSRYGDLKKEDLFTAIKNHIESKGVFVLDFAKSCANECVNYINIITVNESLGVARPFVRSLMTLDVQPAIPLLLSCELILDDKGLKSVAQWILVFVARYSIVGNLDASGMESVFFQLAREVRALGPKPDAKKCLSMIKERLVQHAPTDEQVIGNMPTLILGSDDAGYFMTRLANAMQSKTKEVAINESNLEHIFPKNPVAGWKNADDLQPMLWHAGNLTMLGERLNRGVGNDVFDVKREHYEKKSELAMARAVAQEYKKWNVTNIVDRAKKFAPLVVEVWNFNNPSRV